MKGTWYLTGFLILALLIAGKTISVLYSQNQALNTDLTNAAATIEAKDQTIETMKSQLTKVHQLDITLNQELANANQKIEDLEHDLASNSKRLFVNANCPASVPSQPTTASVVNERTCELNPNARQDYLRLRRELERSRLQITGLQRYIQTLPAECIQGNQTQEPPYQDNHQ